MADKPWTLFDDRNPDREGYIWVVLERASPRDRAEFPAQVKLAYWDADAGRIGWVGNHLGLCDATYWMWADIPAPPEHRPR